MGETVMVFGAKEDVHQCLKCWHKWKQGVYLRQDGQDRMRCPKCNSTQTLLTTANPTKIVAREDLLMFTDGKYPNQYCPRTSAEELFGHQGDIINENGVRIFISRGWANKNYGQYVYLRVDRIGWMTTEEQELQIMQLAVQECPPNARVYVGGLGLGLTLLELAHSKRAREVVVVEREPRVIKYVEPIIRKWFDSHYPEFKWTVMQGNAVEEVGKHGLWDWIFIDIWSDGEGSREGEPKPQEVQTRAQAYLTERGRVTIWTMVVKAERESRIKPEDKARFEHMFTQAKQVMEKSFLDTS